MDMDICLNRHTAGRGLDLPEFAGIAATAGFTGADVDLNWAAIHGASALADLYSKHNLKFGGWGIPFDWRGDEKNRPEGLATLDRHARIAAELKIDFCCTWIMPSSDLPLHQNWHFHIQRLAPIARVLAEHGLRLGLEFVSPYHLRRKLSHEFIFTPLAMLELANDLGPNGGLLVDSFHLHAAGEPMSVLAKVPAKQIVLVHLNDAPPVPLANLEDGKRCLPGEGNIDLAGFLGQLKSAPYTGPIAVEVFSDDLRSLPPQVAAARAFAATHKYLTTLPPAGN
jgi:sugar phosphate isomerase/epimerase